jgi:hypothetical protein
VCSGYHTWVPDRRVRAGVHECGGDWFGFWYNKGRVGGDAATGCWQCVIRLRGCIGTELAHAGDGTNRRVGIRRPVEPLPLGLLHPSLFSCIRHLVSLCVLSTRLCFLLLLLFRLVYCLCFQLLEVVSFCSGRLGLGLNLFRCCWDCDVSRVCWTIEPIWGCCGLEYGGYGCGGMGGSGCG